MEELTMITITNKNGMTATFTNYGAALVSLTAPDRNGNFTDVILGYDTEEEYISGGSSHGATVGRFANRIGGAKFTLNGKTYDLYKNNGENCLHGGKTGFNKRRWDSSVSENSVTFMYISPDGEESFPGEVLVEVRYTLTCHDSLLIEYRAKAEDDTIINLTNHSYFNLGGQNSGTSLDTQLQILAESYTPFDNAQIPTGEIASVKGTVFDFTEPKLIGEDIRRSRLDPGGTPVDNYDHNYILGDFGIKRTAAVAYHEASGRVMETVTDMPAMQFYTAKHLDEAGKGGVHYNSYAGFCLETQFTPDSPNLPEDRFPSCVLRKGEEFKSFTEYRFSVK